MAQVLKEKNNSMEKPVSAANDSNCPELTVFSVCFIYIFFIKKSKWKLH